MTADEIRAAIETLGTSQEGLGRTLAISGRTIRRYCAGKNIPADVERRVKELVARKTAND